MAQDAFWVTPLGVQLPWAGLDKAACKYVEPQCGASLGNGNQLTMSYPIDISEFYPSVRNQNVNDAQQ